MSDETVPWRDSTAVLVEPVPGLVPGLWNVEMRDGRWLFDLTLGQMQQLARPGLTLAICPSCRTSRWYGYGPCDQCGTLLGIR